MKKEVLEKHLLDGKTISEIALKEGKGRGTIQYWMKKYCLKTNNRTHLGVYLCATCGESDGSNFYGHKTSMCKSCDNKRVKDKSSKTRDRAIQYLGGKCISCGFDKSKYAFDIHHLDKSKKDSGFGNMSHWSWNRIEKELETCVLLCKNCHAMVHGNEMTLQS